MVEILKKSPFKPITEINSIDSTYIPRHHCRQKPNWQQHIMENLKNNCHPTLYDRDFMFTLHYTL